MELIFWIILICIGVFVFFKLVTGALKIAVKIAAIVLVAYLALTFLSNMEIGDKVTSAFSSESSPTIEESTTPQEAANSQYLPHYNELDDQHTQNYPSNTTNSTK